MGNRQLRGSIDAAFKNDSHFTEQEKTVQPFPNGTRCPAVQLDTQLDSILAHFKNTLHEMALVSAAPLYRVQTCCFHSHRAYIEALRVAEVYGSC